MEKENNLTRLAGMEKSQCEISISDFIVTGHYSCRLGKFTLNFRGLTIHHATCLFTPRGNLVFRFEGDFCWEMAEEDHSKIISLLSEQVENARGRGELKEPVPGESKDDLPF